MITAFSSQELLHVVTKQRRRRHRSFGAMPPSLRFHAHVSVQFLGPPAGGVCGGNHDAALAGSLRHSGSVRCVEKRGQMKVLQTRCRLSECHVDGGAELRNPSPETRRDSNTTREPPPPCGRKGIFFFFFPCGPLPTRRRASLSNPSVGRAGEGLWWWWRWWWRVTRRKGRGCHPAST